MGTPAPYQNLIPEPSEAIRDERVCQVLDVTGAKAVVDDAGTQLTALIPGSMLGVAVGKTVVVKSSGNSRTIVRVVTPRDVAEYAGTAAVRRTIPVASSTVDPGTVTDPIVGNVRNVTNPSSTGLSQRTIVSLADQTDWNRDTGSLYAALVSTVTGLTNANTETRLAIDVLETAVHSLVTVSNRQTQQIKSMTTTLGQIREYQATQTADLAQIGIVESA